MGCIALKAMVDMLEHCEAAFWDMHQWFVGSVTTESFWGRLELRSERWEFLTVWVWTK